MSLLVSCVQASIAQLVKEIGEEEDRLLSELELTKQEMMSNAQRHVAAEREMAAHLKALKEERDELHLQVRPSCFKRFF